MLRNFMKHLSARNLRCSLKNNAVTSNFANQRSIAPLSTTELALKDEKVKVTFVLYDGKRLETEAKVGDTLLDVVVNNDLNIEGYGACEGTLTCSTCHVVLKPDDYNSLSWDLSSRTTCRQAFNKQNTKRSFIQKRTYLCLRSG
nr:adrenodoxin, mitochondrial isoform X2 [Helicoverpa armigera]